MDADGISASDWAKGIALSILASLIGGASKLSIRKSWLIQDSERTMPIEPIPEESNAPLSLDESVPDETTGSPSSWPKWVPYAMRYSGMFGMSVLNPICCVLAMNYASPSILAPFSGLTLVWVILFSDLVVGERPSRAQTIACCLIVVGEVIVAIFGDHTNDDDVTVDDVRKSYQDPYFVAFFVGLTLYVLLLAYWIRYSNSTILRRFAWGSCGGAITGLQNFLKDSLTIIKATKDGSYPWFLPLFFLLAGLSAFVGLLMLTACMKRYDATYSAASFVGSFVVSASIMSAFHYNTFGDLESLVDYILYPTGLAILMLGVVMLVLESQEPTNSDDDMRRVRKNSEDSESPFAYQQLVDDEPESNEVV